MRWSLHCIMKQDTALQAVTKWHNRSDPALVAKALEVLDCLIPPRDGMQAQAHLVTLQAEAQHSWIKTSNIFNSNQLKRISDILNWNVMSRRTRNDSGDMKLHGHKLLVGNLKYQIFHFANHATRYSRLSNPLWSKAMKYCATILLYDNGYRTVRGISKLERTWQRSMEESNQTGNNNHPLHALYKGSNKYTDMFEVESPGSHTF